MRGCGRRSGWRWVKSASGIRNWAPHDARAAAGGDVFADGELVTDAERRPRRLRRAVPLRGRRRCREGSIPDVRRNHPDPFRGADHTSALIGRFGRSIAGAGAPIGAPRHFSFTSRRPETPAHLMGHPADRSSRTLVLGPAEVIFSIRCNLHPRSSLLRDRRATSARPSSFRSWFLDLAQDGQGRRPPSFKRAPWTTRPSRPSPSSSSPRNA